MELEPLTLTLKAFCAATGVGRTTAYKLIAAREVERVSLGGRTLITYSSIKAYLDRARTDTQVQR